MWKKHFEEEDIFFVTPDVKRGLGFAGILSGYHIICSDFDPIIPILRKQGAKIFCLASENIDVGKLRNSAKILENRIVLDYIKKHSKAKPQIMYFKPSLKLDILIDKNGFRAIGNDSAQNEFFEDKISFYQLGRENFSEYTNNSLVGKLGSLNYLNLSSNLGLPFVIQFGHGWAGKTTFIISSEGEFNDLVQKYPFTRVKISKYIDGFTVLNNCCIYQKEVFISKPAIQIDGITKLSDKPTVTCGRQWPVKFIGKNEIAQIEKISNNIGQLMKRRGFFGFFGIDFLIEEKTGKIYVSEINPRLTASSAFFTLMEIGSGEIPLLAYHLAHFLGKALPERKISNDFTAAQIILRKSFNQLYWRDKLFGVYRNAGGKPNFLKDTYDPAGLNQDEYIYMGKEAGIGDSTPETARIETKSEVLEKPKKLKKWLEDLL